MEHQVSAPGNYSGVDILLTARALAATHGVQVTFSNARTASTRQVDDGYVIDLPCGLEFTAEIDHYLRGFIDHEVGHVKYTDFSRVSNFCLSGMFPIPMRVVQSLYNIYEDVRIEQKMMATFPGSRTNLRRLNAALFERSLPMPCADVDLQKDSHTHRPYQKGAYITLVAAMMQYLMQAPFIKLYGLTKDIEAELHLAFSRTNASLLEEPFTGKLHRLVDDSLKAQTQAEVESLTSRTVDMFAELMEESLRSNCFSDEAAMPDIEMTESACRQLQQVCDGIKEGNCLPRVDEENAPDGMLSPGATCVYHAWVNRAQDVAFGSRASEDFRHDVLLGRMNECACNPQTQDAAPMSALLEELRLLPVGGSSRGTYAKRNLTADEQSQVWVLETKTRSLFQSLLQTITYRRAHTGRVGARLDSQHLYRPRLGDGRVFYTKAERQALDTDVLLILDASSSMAKDIRIASQAVHAMARALKALPHVRAAAYSFNTDGLVSFIPWQSAAVSLNQTPIPCGGTPLGGVTLQALSLFPAKQSPNTRQLVFVLTDGYPDNDKAFSFALRQVEAKGLELYGLTLGRHSNLKAFLPKERMCHAESIKEFVTQLRNMLRMALWRDVRCA